MTTVVREDNILVYETYTIQHLKVTKTLASDLQRAEITVLCTIGLGALPNIRHTWKHENMQYYKVLIRVQMCCAQNKHPPVWFLIEYTCVVHRINT